MDGMQLFYGDADRTEDTQLCKLTCDRLNSFLPSLKQEIFYVPPPPAPAKEAESSGNVYRCIGSFPLYT